MLEEKGGEEERMLEGEGGEQKGKCEESDLKGSLQKEMERSLLSIDLYDLAMKQLDSVTAISMIASIQLLPMSTNITVCS